MKIHQTTTLINQLQTAIRYQKRTIDTVQGSNTSIVIS